MVSVARRNQVLKSVTEADKRTHLSYRQGISEYNMPREAIIDFACAAHSVHEIEILRAHFSLQTVAKHFLERYIQATPAPANPPNKDAVFIGLYQDVQLAQTEEALAEVINRLATFEQAVKEWNNVQA